ncbi:DAK2 domain-containing protein [Cohnella lubricantis]
MVLVGAERLARHQDRVNELNVFPVPDGDTGTNMNMTMTAGAAELRNRPSDEVGRAAEVLAKGLLMGARGNSGVILSQLFRGFSRAVAGQQELTVPTFAAALQQGVDTAYKSVGKPIEGTILTVAREAAKHGLAISRRTAELAEWMEEVLDKAQETLERTPDMLPVLKQVGVVDSGGQGLVYIYEGFRDYLASHTGAGYGLAPNEPAAGKLSSDSYSSNRPAAAPNMRHLAQSRIETESIEFPYDMEFFIRRDVAKAGPFPEDAFRKTLEKDGDSIILIDEGDIVKVHVHSRRPGDVFNAAIVHGELTEMRILNMRDQHRDLLHADEDAGKPYGSELGLEAASGLPAADSREGQGLEEGRETPPNPDAYEMAPFGIVAVSVGQGNEELLRSLGVDAVISGGQSMNPSTEDFMKAIGGLSVEHVFLLPNNSNVLLAAKQAAELADRPVTVIPSTSIPQGMAALLAYREEDSANANEERMIKALDKVTTGQLTRAVRDTQMNGLDIRDGQYIGILNKDIIAAEDGVVEAARLLLEKMLTSGDELVMILTGEDADPECTGALVAWLDENYPDAEVEVHEGGQPLYPYWFMVEQV